MYEGFLIFILVVVVIVNILLKNINKSPCPKCGKVDFEHATYHKIGKCGSCGFQENISQLEKRLKENQKYV